MANAGCINAIWFDWTYLRTLDTLDSANIGVGVQYCIPAPLDDKRLDYIKYTDKCGCTCCITGENEILVYATNWVIKNFTLTNDDTNEVVNVKWNDLFGSNRAYTMVRYKTWSYPTSISDWTLAVKETTQNQYSVSWYNVSGLTDWTTYYFTAFAVSQDGTIIDVQSKSIKTEFTWKYRYVRWNITSLQDNSTLMQASEIELLVNWTTKFQRPTWTSITCNRPCYSESQYQPASLIDWNTSTKIAVQELITFPILITIDMKSIIDFRIQNITKRRWYNGNDTNSYRWRVPRVYTLEFSKDWNLWKTVDTVTTSYTPSYSNRAVAYTWTINWNL